MLDVTILQETNISITVAAVNTFGTGNPSARVTYTSKYLPILVSSVNVFL